jgi:hypothetical protein
MPVQRSWSPASRRKNLPQKPAPVPRKSDAMNYVLPRSPVFFVVHLLFIGATMALVAYH